MALDETPPVLSSADNTTRDLYAPATGDKVPVAPHAHEADKTGRPGSSKLQIPRDQAQSSTALVRTTDRLDEPAAPVESLVSGFKRPQASMKDFFTPSKPAPKKIKTTPVTGPNPKPTIPKPYLTTKKTITMAEVNPDECVHRYSRHKGFYVLRCNTTACKKKVGAQEPTPRDLTSSKVAAQLVVYFTANPTERTGNPLESNHAMGHFRGKGHSLRDMSDVYEKYAVRVIDATEEQNTGNTANKGSCLKLGPCNGKKATVSDSILDRVESTDTSTSVSAEETEVLIVTSPKTGSSLQKSPTTHKYDKQPTTELSTPKSADKSTPLNAEQEQRRKAPARAANSVASYGPSTIPDFEDEADSRLGSKITRRETHVPRGKDTAQGSRDVVAAQGDKASTFTAPSPSPSRPKKGKSKEVDIAMSSDSDDSDSSIPAIGAAIRKMSKLTSRIV